MYIKCTQILDGSLTAALMNLNDVLLNATVSGVASEPEDLTAVAYLLSATVNRLGNQTVEPAISQVCRGTRMESTMLFYLHVLN